MKQKPDLSFWKLWNLSFGFFGVQIAYALQSANISRIFRTLGADPHDLSFFWILPPLMGILVQPIIGTLSDRTWTRFGRRIPYLFVGAAVAVAVMCLLPNSGSLGLGISSVMIFGLLMLMLLDTSINMAMQPFKMLVGDMVNEKQKAKAYSIQSFLCNAGSVVGFLFPFVFTWIGLKNVAAEGVVPDSVIWSFYVGAAILILCVLYTTSKVKEWPPQEYAEYNGGAPLSSPEGDTIDPANRTVEAPSGAVGGASGNWFVLLKNAPAAFWRIGLVQFFCWAAFLYMWTYSNGAIASNCFGVDMTDPSAASSTGFQAAGNWVGVVFAVQAVGSLVWAAILPRFKSIKLSYVVSLLLGAVGFASIMFIHNQWVLFGSYFLIGFAWAAMLALPFTLLTNALEGSPYMGSYLGLFNCTICLPQIVAAATGGAVISLVGSQPAMLLTAGVFLVLGALSVHFIKTK